MSIVKGALYSDLSRGATITIASATALNKSQYDYACDGTADEVEINAAIESLDGIGGCVELSDGTFYLQNAQKIFINSGIWLKGQGASTILFGYDNFTSVAVDFFQEDEATGIPSKITDLCITNCLTGVIIARFRTVYVEGCTIYGCNQMAISVLGTATVTNCEIVNNGSYGIKCLFTAENSIITNNRFANNTSGNVDDLGTNNIIENNVEVSA